MLFSGPAVDEGALVSPAGVVTAGTTTAIAAGGPGCARSAHAPGTEEHRQPTLRVIATTPGASNESVGIFRAPPRLEFHTTLLTLVFIDGYEFTPVDSHFMDFHQKSAGFTQPYC